MRNQKIIFFITLVVISIFGCTDKSQKSSSSIATVQIEKKSPGKIEFSEEIHNFGKIKAGEIVSYSFKFKNSGENPVIITKVATGCNCISLKFDKNEIGGGLTSYIEVILDSHGEWGNLLKTVDVEISTGEKKVLTLGANVENESFNLDLNSSK